MSVVEVDLRIGGEVDSLHLEPGDTIIVSLDQKISVEMAERMREQLRERFPGHEVVILPPGIRISRRPVTA